MATANELIRLKEKIESAKTEKAKLEGRRDEALRRLKDEFGAGSVAEAKELRADLVLKLSKIEEKIEAGIAELKGKMA